MKAFTDIEQSKKLAEFLPIESADMCYMYLGTEDKKYQDIPICAPAMEGDLCAWSLAALLDVLPKKYYPIKDHETDLILGKPKDKWCALYWDATGMQDGEQTIADNPIDACVAMIEKLHQLKVL